MVSDIEDSLPDEEPIEAYCVICRMKVEMEHPVPVWTRRGAPGTRGECPICGTTIFRMGRTDAHLRLVKPEQQRVAGKTSAALGRPGKPRFAVYVNYSQPDAGFASHLAEGLIRVGVPTWADPDVTLEDSPHWASGVPPALLDCSHMVVILSPSALEAERVERGWRFFRQHRKPVLLAQIQPCDIPDGLRRQPRFDFAANYKAAFRELVQALAM